MEWFRPLNDRIRAQSFLKSYTSDKHGGGHKVIVIPGLLASDFSTAPLRSFLDRLGYRTIDWGMGRNLGRLEQADQLEALVKQHAADGPVTLVGWSLGGLYARKLAAQYPELIKKVITLASPYRHLEAPNNASWVFNLFQKLRRQSSNEPPAWVKSLPEPVPVSSVAFYTKQDGIVPWEACCDFDDPTDHKNIEVFTSHNALGVNKYVLEKLVEVLD